MLGGLDGEATENRGEGEEGDHARVGDADGREQAQLPDGLHVCGEE